MMEWSIRGLIQRIFKKPEDPKALIAGVRAGSLDGADDVAKLLDGGVDINYQDMDTDIKLGANGIQEDGLQDDSTQGDTALMAAVRGNHLSIVNILIAKKANLNKQNKVGDTALIIAARDGNVEVVKALAKHKANLNKQNASGDTALIIAARGKDSKIAEELVQELVRKGANLNIKNKGGETALSVAQQSNSINRVTLLSPSRPVSPITRRRSSGVDDVSLSSSRGFKLSIKAFFSFRGLSGEEAFAKAVGVLLFVGVVGVACYFALPALPVVGLTGLAAQLVWTGACALAALSLFLLGNALSQRPTVLSTATQRRFFYGKLFLAFLCAAPLVALLLPFMPIYGAVNAFLGNTLGIALSGWPAFTASVSAVLAVPALVLGLCYRALRPKGLALNNEIDSDLVNVADPTEATLVDKPSADGIVHSLGLQWVRGLNRHTLRLCEPPVQDSGSGSESVETAPDADPENQPQPTEQTTGTGSADQQRTTSIWNRLGFHNQSRVKPTSEQEVPEAQQEVPEAQDANSQGKSGPGSDSLKGDL